LVTIQKNEPMDLGLYFTPNDGLFGHSIFKIHWIGSYKIIYELLLIYYFDMSVSAFALSRVRSIFFLKKALVVK